MKMVKPAVVTTNVLNAMNEASWESAAVWRVQVPQAIQAREGLLRLNYVGDVARFYAGGRLILDNFYDGQPFDLALWRLSPAELANLELCILPLRADRVKRLPTAAEQRLEAGRATAKITAVEQLEKQSITITFARSHAEFQGQIELPIATSVACNQ